MSTTKLSPTDVIIRLAAALLVEGFAHPVAPALGGPRSVARARWPALGGLGSVAWAVRVVGRPVSSQAA